MVLFSSRTNMYRSKTMILESKTSDLYLVTWILRQKLGADIDAVDVFSSPHLAHGIPDGGNREEIEVCFMDDMPVDEIPGTCRPP